jgi:hypothetical protein
MRMHAARRRFLKVSAAYAADRPLSPSDIVAAIYNALGIDSEIAMADHEGRTRRLCEGKPVAELFESS